jgi:hypothetical protein
VSVSIGFWRGSSRPTTMPGTTWHRNSSAACVPMGKTLCLNSCSPADTTKTTLYITPFAIQSGDYFFFRHSHGGTGCGSAHKLFLPLVRPSPTIRARYLLTQMYKPLGCMQRLLFRAFLEKGWDTKQLKTNSQRTVKTLLELSSVRKIDTPREDTQRQ